ncbi:MAG TPA: toll/interleukin-1 receptor domain-containing protein [Candidatus Obscuribacterales bacterium]
MAKKLCVCGRSQHYPICDASHESEGWTCQTDAHWATYGFCASPLLQNLAMKLSSHYQGLLCNSPGQAYQVETLVILVEGTELAKPLAIAAQVESRRRIVMGLGHGTALLQPLFADSEIYALAPDRIPHAFAQVKAILAGDAELVTPAETRRLFVSHAVADERLIMPVLSYLKSHYQARIFACQDSIPEGRSWHEAIITGLTNADRVVVLISRAMLASTFCAFEIGYALALEKELSLILLDDTHPPAYVQHLQMNDLGRCSRLQPWLSQSELLTDLLLQQLERAGS